MRTLLSCLAIALFAGIVGCGETTTPPATTPATESGSSTEGGDAGSATEGGEAGSSTSATAVPEGMVKVSLNVPGMS